MLARLLADLVLTVHFGFILFALFGALLCLRWPLAAFAHLPALAWAAYISFTAGVCPLTPLENSLRRAGGEADYSGTFVEQYLGRIVYPQGLDADLQGWMAVGLLVLNAWIYAMVAVRRVVRRKDEARPKPR
ncbi:MAG: DUF2784 domain-containing protein [Acidobacteria bacterium]|nr:MAG: DUF2784 domain-containing protein [Acidobacteriota bacterium]REK03238.1 MAG: DUF2784 domain-containing protein [Acidobacteriota bacterium]